MPHGLS